MIKLKNLIKEVRFVKFYHGSVNADKIIKSGFDIDFKRFSDPGDFGWGIYFTNNKSKAKSYGKIIEADIDLSKFAYIENPYFMKGLKLIEPRTKSEKLFYNLAFDDNGTMLTLHGDNREQINKKIREEFLKNGYKGIVTRNNDELVVFDVKTIKGVKLI